MYKGRVLGDDCKVKRPIQEIVGSSNEADVKVDGKKAKALVDTGSGMSTISEELVRNFTEIIYNTESFNHYMTCCKCNVLMENLCHIWVLLKLTLNQMVYP